MRKVVVICIVLGILLFVVSMVLNVMDLTVFMEENIVDTYGRDMANLEIKAYGIKSQYYMSFHLLSFLLPVILALVMYFLNKSSKCWGLVVITLSVGSILYYFWQLLYFNLDVFILAHSGKMRFTDIDGYLRDFLEWNTPLEIVAMLLFLIAGICMIFTKKKKKEPLPVS